MEMNEKTPIAQTLMEMEKGDTERFPIERLAAIGTTANRLKTQKKGEWTTSRNVEEGVIEVTRVA